MVLTVFSKPLPCVTRRGYGMSPLLCTTPRIKAGHRHSNSFSEFVGLPHKELPVSMDYHVGIPGFRPLTVQQRRLFTKLRARGDAGTLSLATPMSRTLLQNPTKSID